MEFRFWCCSVVFLCSVIFFSSASICRADDESSEKEYVLTLDRSNFSEIVSKHDFIVVEFYAPWCGHCKKLAPEYEKAASILSKRDPPLVLAKVDANDELNKELASQYEVSGYPSLKILRDGGKSIQEYKGPREADGIVTYVEKQAGPASIEIKSPEDVPNIKDENKIFIAGVFPELSGEEFDNFTKLAKRLRGEYDLGHTLDAKLLPFGESSVRGPLVRLLKPFDELFINFKDFDVDVLEKLVEKSSIPTVTVFNKDPSNHPYVIKFFNSLDAKALLFVNFSAEHFDKFKSNYHDTAALYKGKGVSFLLGDAESASGALQYFGLKEDQVPLIIVQKDEHKKYLQSNLNPDRILLWMNDYMEGRLPEYVKSEPIPEKNDEPVKVVVSHTLEQMVLNSGKNVLLEIYAPWCGHCKKLAPILEEVAVALEGEHDVVIAKFDGTVNDYPRDRLEVKGYPTLYFVSASGKMVQYEGERTKEAMIEFIQKNRENTVEPDSVKETQSPSDSAKGDALDSGKDEL